MGQSLHLSALTECSLFAQLLTSRCGALSDGSGHILPRRSAKKEGPGFRQGLNF
jgi:hypothetical protein